MKIEVEFRVEEVTRYKIVRHYETDSDGFYSTGFDVGGQYGEFETRGAAERVKEALDATLGNKLRQAL